MNLASYRAQKAAALLHTERFRDRCFRCQRPGIACFCGVLKPFAPFPRFVILIHPLEARRKIATGRMAHLGLTNSLLARGIDFTESASVNAALAAPDAYPLVLYPAPGAVNLTHLPADARRSLVPPGKKPVVVVIDGTWHTAKRMRRESLNLKAFPMICFDPPAPSRFRVRHQPEAHCYSTIEAIHQVIELFGTPDRRHDNLLETFAYMVEQQLEFRVGRRV